MDSPEYEAKFTQYPIKSYKYWYVYLHKSQVYLGRCKIALKRQGELDPFLDTTPEEKAELHEIIVAIKAALDELYQPGLLNYANFRNTWHRCHWHVIPRYETEREFGGYKFIDSNWGKNYAPYDRGFKISEAVMQQIRSDIAQKLG